MGFFDSMKTDKLGKQAYNAHVQANDLQRRGKVADARKKYDEALALYKQAYDAGCRKTGILMSYSVLMMRYGMFAEGRELMKEISAIGGMVYITTIAGCVWNHEGLSGVGWLAVALVIFCTWRPLSAVWGSVLFGALMILYLRLQIPFIPTQLYKILPYVVTVIVLVISSMRNNKEKQPPEALGLSYFREDR